MKLHVYSLSLLLALGACGPKLSITINNARPPLDYTQEEVRDFSLQEASPKVDQAVDYQFNYYGAPEIPLEVKSGREKYPSLRLGVGGGLSYRLAKTADFIPPDLKNYINDLKSGYHFGLDLTYFFSDQIGAGVKYAVHKSSNRDDQGYLSMPDGSTIVGLMSDKITISFIGPTIGIRSFDMSKNNSFFGGLGLGYMGYLNKTIVIDEFTIHGGAVGLSWDVGYDIGLSENLALGIQISCLFGSLTKYTVSIGSYSETIDLDENSYENLSRFDLTIGLRFVD